MLRKRIIVNVIHILRKRRGNYNDRFRRISRPVSIYHGFLKFTEHFLMATSDINTQSFAAYKIKPIHLINDVINDLGYL